MALTEYVNRALHLSPSLLLAAILTACGPAVPPQPATAVPKQAAQPTAPTAESRGVGTAPAATAAPAATPTAAPAVKKEKTKVTIAFGLPLGNPSNPFAWIGDYLGYFDEEAVEVTFQSTGGNNAQQDAMLISGQIEAGIFGLEQVLRPAASGKEVPARAVFNVQNRSQYEGIVLEDSDIRTTADLKGKTIAIPQLGATLETYMSAVLKDAGLSPDDVKYLATGIGPPMGEALKRGEVAAAFGTRGQIGPLELQYKFRFLPRPKFADEFITGNVVARTSMRPEQEAGLRGYLRAYARSIVFSKENPEAAMLINWKMYPESKPKGVSEEQALRDAVKIYTDYLSYIDKLEGKWGYMPPDKIAAYVRFLGLEGKLPNVETYYTNEWIDFINQFDEDKVREQARNFKIAN